MANGAEPENPNIRCALDVGGIMGTTSVKGVPGVGLKVMVLIAVLLGAPGISISALNS